MGTGYTHGADSLTSSKHYPPQQQKPSKYFKTALYTNRLNISDEKDKLLERYKLLKRTKEEWKIEIK